MLNIKSRFQNFVNTLKPMSWKQRLDHLITYYKPVLIGVCILIILISIGANAVKRSMYPPLCRGAVVGVTATDSLRIYLSDDLQVFLDGPDSKRQTVLKEIPFMDITLPDSMATNQTAYYQLTALVSGQELDYALLDTHAWDLFKDGYFFADIRTVLPQDLIDAVSSRLIWVTPSDSDASAPLGIDVTDLALTGSDNQIVLAFTGNTDNNSAAPLILQHLLNWASR